MNVRARMLRAVLVWLAMALLAGCANLQTVSRRTTFPNHERPMAIHLDAQQRLVIRAGERYCAEPSPDALAAYASSLGLGLTSPGEGAASTALALQGSAASIGLRTQSITLMRDALFRLCEASMNRTVNDLQVAEFLRRSQDLTAVVLAIEQLTGAVAASNSILTSNASANGSAQLLGNQQALEAARKAEAAADAARQSAEQAANDAATASTKADQALATALKGQAAVPPTATPAQVATAQSAADAARATLAVARQRLDAATQSWNEAVAVRTTIEAARDAAMASSAASTAGNGQFAGAVQRQQMSADATKEIATAVNQMVTSALNKDYSVDTCMMFLTDESGRADRADLDSIKRACLFLIASRTTAAAKGAALTTDELEAVKEAVYAAPGN